MLLDKMENTSEFGRMRVGQDEEGSRGERS